MLNRRRVIALRRRRGYVRNVVKSGTGPASVSPVNRRRQPHGARTVRARPQRGGWRIGAMSGSNASAMWLAVVLVGAYLLFHKRS